MITLVKTDLETLRHYVKLGFEGDKELLEKYHISPGTLDHCVEHTMGFIIENAEHYKNNIEFYAVVENVETPIGYTVIIRNKNAPNELYSFGINVKYRNKETNQEWLAAIKEKLKSPYYIVLWSKNDRAVNFFEKNDFIVDNDSELLNDKTKTLILCPEL